MDGRVVVDVGARAGFKADAVSGAAADADAEAAAEGGVWGVAGTTEVAVSSSSGADSAPE